MRRADWEFRMGLSGSRRKPEIPLIIDLRESPCFLGGMLCYALEDEEDLVGF